MTEERIRELEEELYLLYSSRKHSTPSILECLEEVVDKLLTLKQLLQNDSLSSANNPGLIFLNFLQDVLGNPQQIRIRDSRVIIKDIHLAKLCSDFAELLIEFKRSQKMDHFHDNPLIEQIRQYRDKIHRRNSYTHAEVERFYLLLQEDFPDRKSQGIIARFLGWFGTYL